MTEFAALAGARVTTMSVGIPMYGLWAGDVTVATATPLPATASPLTIGDLSLLGTAFRLATFSGASSARLVGGYGGWRKTAPRQAYVGGSVRLSIVLKDAATVVGERLTLDVPDANIARYTRAEGPASRSLSLAAGPLWYVAPDGVTHVGPRPGGLITSDFDVIMWTGATGKFTIATETLADWMPGRTFTAPTVPGVRTVSYTEIGMDNDGRLRLEVLA